MKCVICKDRESTRTLASYPVCDQCEIPKIFDVVHSRPLGGHRGWFREAREGDK